jgi:putative RNA 2'-phosphotransferase
MPVTQAALEASWQPFVERGVVWHGTTIDVLEAIHTGGLLPFKRTHVHLAPAFDSVVGKRKNRPVMLAISTEKMRSLGVELWRAPNAVVLSRSVPRAAIVGAKPITRRAKRSADAIAALFGRA